MGGSHDACVNALTWRSILLKLTAGSNLSSAETGWAIAQTVGGQASSIEIAAFLVALRTKGETAEELHGVVQALLDGAIRIDLPFACHDIAGTGGDGTGAMNISTLAAMVAAGSGCTVVKHGGRAASSATAGSADLVEALGIPLVVSPDDVRHAAMSRRFSYLFAPVFNPGCVTPSTRGGDWVFRQSSIWLRR